MFKPTLARNSALRKDVAMAIALLRASKRQPTVAEFIELNPLPPPLAHLQPIFLKMASVEEILMSCLDLLSLAEEERQ
jgi:hypothetical protein